MFDYTQVAWKQIVADFQKILYIVTVFSQAVYVAYLTYALFSGAGVFWVNLTLLVLSVSYAAFFLAVTKGGKAPDGVKQKIVKKLGAKIYKWSKLLLKIYPVVLTVYGLYETSKNVTFFAVLLVCFMIVGWILQAVFEIIGAIFSSRFQLLVEGLKADVEEIKRPVSAVGNFFKKITGQEAEEVQEPTKHRMKLQEKVDIFRTERQEKKRREKQASHERSLQKKSERRTKKAEEKQEKQEKKRSVSLEKRLLKNAEKQEKSAAKSKKKSAKANSSSTAVSEEKTEN